MDPISAGVLLVAALVIAGAIYITWDFVGEVVQIVVIIAVIALVFGLLDNPHRLPLDIIYGYIRQIVDFAHNVRNIVTKP